MELWRNVLPRLLSTLTRTDATFEEALGELLTLFRAEPAYLRFLLQELLHGTSAPHPIIFVTFAVHCFSVSLCCRSTSPEWQFKQAPSASPLAEPSGSGAMTVPNGGRSGDGFGMPRPVKAAKRIVTATTTANGAFAVTP